VPKGMEAHADWMNLPEQPVVAEPTDFGPKYKAIEQRRKALMVLKKTLAAISPPIASILANRALLQTVEGQPEKVAKLEALIESNKKARDAALETLKKETQEIKDLEYGPQIEALIERATQPMDKADHVAFEDTAKKLGQAIFRETNKGMQDLKAAKKEFLEEQKQSEAGSQ